MPALIAQRALVITSSIATRSGLEALLRESTNINLLVSSDEPAEIANAVKAGNIGIVDAIFIEASLSAQNRSEHSGVKLGQYLRRECGFCGYLIFLGFQSKEGLEPRFSLLGKVVPGSEYIQLPVRAVELEEASQRIHNISTAELASVVLAHCGLHETIRTKIHSVANRISRAAVGPLYTPPEYSLLTNEVMGLRDDLVRYELEAAVRLAERVVKIVQAGNQLTLLDQRMLLELLDQIDASFVSGRTDDASSSSHFHSRALMGYDTVLIADDEGYPDIGLDYFKGLGYSVTLVTSYDEASVILSSDPGAVFLCDQTFGNDSSAGRRLMALARREQWKLIIALSGARLDAAEVPEADAICAGPLAKLDTGARRVHEIICEWATTHP
jgi:hypothetical protein